MKKITFLLLGLFMTSNAIADDNSYVPLVREGVVWEYVLYNNFTGFNPNYELIYTLEFNGTTMIEEDGTIEEYYNLYRTDYDSSSEDKEPLLVGCVKENDKVVEARIINFDDFPKDFYRGFYQWTPNIVYDFNKPLFMSIENEPFFDIFNGYTTECIEENINGSIRKVYHLYDGPDLSGEEIKIIEGVGIDCVYGDLLVPFRDFVTGGKISVIKSNIDDIAELMGDVMAGLSAVYEDGELVYQGCLYDEAQKLKNADAISIVTGYKQVESVCYYNLAGVESTEPQPGMNIKVTTYSDGTRKSEKVVY